MARLTESHSARDAAAGWFVERVESLATADPVPGREIAMVERTAPLGSMGPLHRRDEDETYRVLEGQVTFFVGADVVTAGPGDVVVASAGAPRTFRADSEATRWLVLTRVSSLELFVDFGRAVAVPAAAAAEPPAIAAMAAANGIELLGPPGALPTA